MANQPGGVKRELDNDSNPNPPQRQQPGMLDYIFDRGLVRTLWNPFSSGNGEPPSANPGTGTNSSRDPPVQPPQTAEIRLWRDIFGLPRSGGGGGDPPTPPESDINFGSCGGMEEQVDYVRRNVIWILNNRIEFRRWGIEPAKGVIFYGPPGSGKTLFAKALANELRTPQGRPFSFFMKKGPEMFGMYVGQTEGAIRTLFAEAKAKAPSIIFLDELDGLCSSREDSSPNSKFHNGVVTTMLGCMDEVVRGEVLVIGATNRLETIDPALRRPGRFDKCISFHLPNAEARTTILGIHTRRWQNRPSLHDFEAVASATVGYTGADLEQLCRETFVIAFHRHFPNFDSTAPLNLSTLQILPEDWKKAMRDSTRSNTNVFGLAHFSGQLASPAIRLLTLGIEQELSAKLCPWLCRLRQTEEVKLHACLMWSEHRRTLETANNFIIPSFISTIDATEFLTFKMDLEHIANSKTINTFMAKVVDTRKTRLLFIPFIDDLMEMAVRAHSWLPLTTALGRLRGTNTLLLATASSDKCDLQEDLASLFSTGESVQVRKATTVEARGFFQQVFSVGFYEEVQRGFPDTPGQGDATARTPAALNKLGKDLGRLLGRAVDFAVRHELQDSMDLKGDLVKASNSKLTPAELVVALKEVLDSYHPDPPGGRRRHPNLYN